MYTLSTFYIENIIVSIYVENIGMFNKLLKMNGPIIYLYYINISVAGRLTNIKDSSGSYKAQ